MTNKEKWLNNYKEAVEYYKKHGDLLVPANYTIKTKDNNELNLRSWIYSQRKKYKNGTLEEDKIKLLNQIKMVWEVDDYKKDKKTGITNYWFKMYEYSKQYYQSHGDLLIPKRYKIKDKTNEDVKLGIWIINQRVLYKTNKLSEEKIKLLNEIDMVWNNRKKENSSIWLEVYSHLKEYYIINNSFVIPTSYKVTLKNGNTLILCKWLVTQRKNYKLGKLSEKRIELLNDINFNWDTSRSSIDSLSKDWLENYKYAAQYYKEHNSLKIPINYEVKTNENKTLKIGWWILLQRRLKNQKETELNIEKIRLLNKIGMIWNVDKVTKRHEREESTWFKHYKELVLYYKKFGNINISSNYKITNENNEILELGMWLTIQYFKYENSKLTEEKLSLLKEVGFTSYINYKIKKL